MAEFMMLMKANGSGGSSLSGWDAYIKRLSESGLFRGGSALGNGVCVNRDGESRQCQVSGFMRFEATTIEQVLDLVSGKPVYDSGDSVEVLQLHDALSIESIR